MNVNGSGGNRSEKKPTIRKRRFLQQAHPVIDGAINNASAISTPRKKQQARQTSTSDELTSTEQPENTRISPPLRTNKSIEELEAILEKRFGNTANSLIFPSPHPKKKMNAMANKVLDPWAKEENMMGSNVRATKTTSPALGTTKSSTIRSTTSTTRDIDIQKSKRGRGIDNYDANETQLSSRQSQRQGQQQQRTFNREDAMLNKVRLNQERLQSKKKIGGGGGGYGGKGAEDANYDTRQTNNHSNYRCNDLSLPIISVSRRDYYDADDEGYEEAEERGKTGRKTRGRKEIDEDNNLPKAENLHEKRTKKSSSFSSVVSSGGGIFFSNTRNAAINQQKSQEGQTQQRALSPNNNASAGAKTATNDVKSNSDDTKEVKRLKRKDPVSLPVLDENGQEMFLTLEQAEKIVKNILSSTQSASLDSDEESSMGNNDRKNEDNSIANDINQWEDIGITDPALLSNLRSSNKLCCPNPLAAQDRACPPIVAGNDVLLSTHTGSGKTLAFLAPIAQSLLINGGGGGGGAYPKAIVIAPGRELASQIVSVAQTLFADTGLTVALAIGGTPYSRNLEKLRKMKPDVVVGVSYNVLCFMVICQLLALSILISACYFSVDSG